MDGIKVKGLNAGRGIWSAVNKQIITKLRNGSISRITGKTFGKMLGVAAFAGAEIQQTLTGNNYMSFLGSSYDTVKGISYGVSYMFPMLASYAPTTSSSSQTGCYLIKRGSKVIYVGKGSYDRMYASMRNHMGTSCVYFPCSSTKRAYVNEAYFLQHYGGAQSMAGLLEYKINSPGLAILF